MEDPWGASPWTTSTDPEKPIDTQSPEPPPRALITSAVPALSYHSPWDKNDDEEFAGWSSANADTGSLAVWGGGWSAGDVATSPKRARSRENSVHSLASRSRSRDNSVSTGNKVWPTIATTSPGPKTPSRSSSRSVLRLTQESLDPWASETTLSLDLPPSPPKVASPGHESTRFQLKDAIPIPEPQDDLESPHWGRDDEADLKSAAQKQADKSTLDQDETTPTKDHNQSHEYDRRSRRASSSCSDDSRHERAQDSPITSIDEDSRSRPIPVAPNPIQRKVSSKVQQMLEKFDGSQKRDTSPSTSIPRPPPANRTNFKDLVEVAQPKEASPATSIPRPLPANRTNFHEVVEVAHTRVELPATSISRPPPSNRTKFEEVVEVAHSRTEPPATSIPRPPPAERANFQQLVDKFGSVQFQDELTDKFGDVKFTPNLKQVDVLFENLGLAKGAVADPDDADVSDRILTDSFAAVSERRVWYRVSRQGTTRLHDAGGDEYYRRVAWQNSEVRNETIKIVRRWMMEDSFGGRPNLGGKGFDKGNGSLFGWDSTAPDEPVNLDEVFKKRQSAPPAPRPAIDTRTPASFSWNSPADTSDPVPASNPFSWSSSPADTKPVATSANGWTPRPVSMFAASRPLDPPTIPKPKSEAPIKADEDDDWGEMVTSPGAQGSVPDPSFSIMQTWEAGGSSTAAISSLPPANSPAPISMTGNPLPTQISANESEPSIDRPPTPKTTDPWGDLCFFGSPPPPAVLPHAAPAQSLPGNMAAAPQASIKKKVVSFANSDPEISQQKGPDSVTNTELEDARRIVHNLPDLSYMLR